MIPRFIFPVLIAIGLLHSAGAQNRFAMLYSSAGMEYGKANAVDLDTNYINGCLFQNSINVNPSGTTILTAPGATTHIALTKYTRHGELIWARMFGGVTTSEAPHGIDCDATRNIYVTGYFGSTTLLGPQSADFNPAGGGTVLTQGHEDCFVAKYDMGGNYIWAFGLGNAGANTQERAWDISVDALGNSYVVGGFHGTMNFNPRGTTTNRTLPDTLAGLFIAKYNADGILQWVVPINAQCTSVFTEGYATCDLDSSGNLYVAGNFRGSNVDFNPLGTPTMLTSSGLTDIFLARYNSTTGILAWVKKIGGPASEIVSPGALRCDNNGNPYFTGRLSGTGSVDFDPSPGIVNVTNSSLYLASFDQGGNLRLAFGMSSGTGDGGHRVAFDHENNFCMAGWMNGTADFGSGHILSAFSPTADVFLAKFTNAGVCQWAFNFGGAGSSDNSICAGLIVDQEKNPIITGQLYGTNADVDPTTGVLSLSSVGNNDCFVIKYSGNGQLWVNDTTAMQTLNVTVAANWNLVSVPLLVTDYLKNTLFPTASSQAFKYQAQLGYITQDTLANRLGYWLKFPSQQNITLIGLPVVRDTINVSRGWNLVGSISQPVAVSAVVPIGTSIQSQFFGFSPTGYTQAETLVPGLGYWVKVSQDGQLVLGSITTKGRATLLK